MTQRLCGYARSIRSVATRSSCRTVRSWPSLWPSNHLWLHRTQRCPGCQDERWNAAEFETVFDIMFDTESIMQLWDNHVLTRRTWTIHESHQRAECANMWGSDRDCPEAPGNDHTQKHTGYKTFLKRRDHRCCSFKEIALLVLKHAGELATAHSWCGCLHEDNLFFSLPCGRDHRCSTVTPSSPEPLMVPYSTPVPLLVPSSCPERPRESAHPKLPRESELSEHPWESVLPERPLASVLQERSLASAPPERPLAFPSAPESWSHPALLRLRWSRPAHLHLRWSRLANLCLRWPRPAHLRLLQSAPWRLRLQSAPPPRLWTSPRIILHPRPLSYNGEGAPTPPPHWMLYGVRCAC